MTKGTLVTQNESREIIEEGAVAISGDTIEMVGPKEVVESFFDPDRRINVSGKILLPGLINAHTHVTKILLRGLGASDRKLIDWIYNVKLPGTAAMTIEQHELVAALYCWESVRSGITTFVDNSTEMQADDLDSIREKFQSFANSGLRTIYAPECEIIKHRILSETTLRHPFRGTPISSIHRQMRTSFPL